jgi:RNA polymerase sigma factor (sigma-70 family)
LKIVQLFPRPATETPDDGGGAADSKTDGPPSSTQSTEQAARTHAQAEAPPRDPVRVVVQTIVRKQRRRVVKLSPAAVLARAAAPGLGRALADPLQIFARVLDRKPVTPPPPAPSAPTAAPIPPAADATTADSQFWQIWLSHRDYLYRFSLRFSNGNAADAEDAMSEAMLKAAAAFHETGIHNQRAWLLRLVHNACMDRHRGRQRQHRMARDVAGDGDFLFPIVAPQHSRSPEELLTAFQLVTELQQALSELPHSLAEPLMLYLDERPDAEIASSLNVSKEVVRKRRQMARDWLRRRLMG